MCGFKKCCVIGDLIDALIDAKVMCPRKWN